MANIRDSLSHTKWLCKYHIVFTPKYRRKAWIRLLKKNTRTLLRVVSSTKGLVRACG